MRRWRATKHEESRTDYTIPTATKSNFGSRTINRDYPVTARLLLGTAARHRGCYLLVVVAFLLFEPIRTCDRD